MTKKGQKQVSGKDLDKQVKVIKKKQRLSFIKQALQNAFSHINEIDKMLDEETEENVGKKPKKDKNE